MKDEELAQKIASFDSWHYQFDLRGHLTPIHHPKFVNRHEQRKKHFIYPLADKFGGSLEGKRVLDLASNAGYWSLASVEAGCDYVLGIEGRQMHVDQAELVFEVKGVEKERYGFVQGDIFQTDFTEYGEFDVVLCLGLFYHVSKHVELLEKIAEVNTDILIIDTRVARASGPWMEIHGQDPNSYMSAVDRTLAMVPTKQAVHDLAKEFGYEVVMLKPDFRDERGNSAWRGAMDYKGGARRAFMCAKRTELGNLAVETEPIELLELRRQEPRSKAGEANRAKRLLKRTDHLLSRLFDSRRWKLAHTLGTALQVARISKGQAPEDQLRELKGEIRALLQRSGRTSSERHSQRGSRTSRV